MSSEEYVRLYDKYGRSLMSEVARDLGHPPVASAVVYQTDRYTIAKRYDESKDKWVRIVKEKKGVDDASVIQSAFDYINSSNGGHLYISRGTYTIDSTLTYDTAGTAGLHLSGAGARNTILSKSFDGTCLEITEHAHQDFAGVVIEGIFVHGNDNDGDAIYIKASGDFAYNLTM
ncbi:MAG: hypothetical protein JRD89_05035 [Deltaproteobacteria bacterium]|nr:hypothetical protein [Deltaproteobacteria bacterium]